MTDNIIIFQDMTTKEIKTGIEKEIFKTQNRKEMQAPASKRLKSEIWDTFHEIIHIESNKVLKYNFFCSKCEAVVTTRKKNVQISESTKKRNVANGNSQLSRHKCVKSQTQLNHHYDEFEFTNTDNEAIKTAFSSFVAVDMRPFSAIENTGFKNVCRTMFHLGQKYTQKSVSNKNFDDVLLKRTAVCSTC